MKKSYTPPKEYFFTPEQEKKVFNLILKNTIEKEIVWVNGSIQEILSGKSVNNRLLYYEGESRISVSIQNKHEYTFFIINKEQARLLKDIIQGKNILRIGSKLKEIGASSDYYLGE